MHRSLRRKLRRQSRITSRLNSKVAKVGKRVGAVSSKVTDVRKRVGVTSGSAKYRARLLRMELIPAGLGGKEGFKNWITSHHGVFSKSSVPVVCTELSFSELSLPPVFKVLHVYQGDEEINKDDFIVHLEPEAKKVKRLSDLEGLPPIHEEAADLSKVWGHSNFLGDLCIRNLCLCVIVLYLYLRGVFVFPPEARARSNHDTSSPTT